MQGFYFSRTHILAYSTSVLLHSDTGIIKFLHEAAPLEDVR